MQNELLVRQSVCTAKANGENARRERYRSKLSIFTPNGLGCDAARISFFLMDRSINPKPSHLGKQRGSFQSEFRRCAAWSTNDPAGSRRVE
jgi:hypothetical protein